MRLFWVIFVAGAVVILPSFAATASSSSLQQTKTTRTLGDDVQHRPFSAAFIASTYTIQNLNDRDAALSILSAEQSAEASTVLAIRGGASSSSSSSSSTATAVVGSKSVASSKKKKNKTANKKKKKTTKNMGRPVKIKEAKPQQQQNEEEDSTSDIDVDEAEKDSDDEDVEKQDEEQDDADTEQEDDNANVDDEKKKISQVLREKDAAQAMGDAIRDRASLLRHATAPSSSSSASSSSPLLDSIDGSVSSVGWAMGASDRRSSQFVSSFIAMQQQQRQQNNKAPGARNEDEDASGGVETATTSVLMHYFLKSHGGAHALQCVCSLLATIAGWTVITLTWFASSSLSMLSMTLMRRCMIFAMMKHVSGLFAATFLTARAIPQVGLSQARVWMQDLVRDPVSQYVFYAACLLLWLPPNSSSSSSSKNAAAATAAAATASTQFLAWWQAYSLVPALLVGPIVLRETISTMLVISDVLVLWTCSSATRSTGRPSQEEEDDDDADKEVDSLTDLDGSSNNNSSVLPLVHAFLKMSTSIVNAIMSILVTPTVWRSANNNVQERQAILAKLTSRTSLVLEVLVGLLLVVDILKSLVAWTFGGGGGAAAAAATTKSSYMTMSSILRRVVCTRLYVHYLWLRRRKIHRLATKIRGGAGQFPFHVLNVLIDPVAAMGCSVSNANHHNDCKDENNARQYQQQQQQQQQRSATESNGGDARDYSKKDYLTWRDYLVLALGS